MSGMASFRPQSAAHFDKALGGVSFFWLSIRASDPPKPPQSAPEVSP